MTETSHCEDRDGSVWITVKNWLSIAVVVLAVAVLFLMLFYGAIFNPDCSMAQMLMFECFRWGASAG